MIDQKYIGCWYCDNIIDHPEQIGLLHLGFPRCFVLIPNSTDFFFYTFDDFLKYAKINWLDPSDRNMYSEEERMSVLELLWNFSIEQEKKEEDLLNDEEIDI